MAEICCSTCVSIRCWHQQCRGVLSILHSIPCNQCNQCQLHEPKVPTHACLVSHLMICRNYYLVSIETAAMYRATMPSRVQGSQRILQTKADRDGWFFWASTDDPGVLVQRKVPCSCARCQGLNAEFFDCLRKAEDTSRKGWWNQPHRQVTLLVLCDCLVLVVPLMIA